MLADMVRPGLCPICRKELPVMDADVSYRPFCSQRCKTIDLGSWLDGRYQISRPVEEEDLDSGPSSDEDA